MISREEAKEDFALQEISMGFVTSSFLDRVYDSIGSCGECKHYDNGTNDCYRMWSISCSTIQFKDWFCADFERKIND